MSASLFIDLICHVSLLGGAVEIMLTGQKSNSSSEKDFRNRIVGYLYLFGNTICMVRREKSDRGRVGPGWERGGRGGR